jgi:hypothetical protein
MKRRILNTILVGVAVCVIAVVFWARGRHDVILDGTLQWSFEESAFFPNGDCSSKPFWWEWPNELDDSLRVKWQALGKPAALRVKVRGNLSWLGSHGHLGAYRREIQPIALVSVSPASRCEWWWGK